MEDILAKLAKDTAPKNFEEFHLGMILLGLYTMLVMDEDDFDPEAYDNLLDMTPEALVYWKEKYAEEYKLTIGKTSESAGDGK